MFFYKTWNFFHSNEDNNMTMQDYPDPLHEEALSAKFLK
jgi:hypothetical protein